MVSNDVETMEQSLLDVQPPLIETEESPPSRSSRSLFDGFTWDIFKLWMAILVYMMSHGLIRGMYPLVLLKATGGSVSMAAYVQGLIFFGIHLLGFLFANPILGTLSDRSDKRKFLALSLVGNMIEAVIVATDPGLKMVCFAAGVRGITSCFVAVAASGIAELSDTASRGKNLALIGVAFGLGMSVGQWIGGWAGAHSILDPFKYAAALNVLGLIWIVLMVPPLNKHVKQDGVWTDALNPFHNMSILLATPALRTLSIVFVLQVAGATFGFAIWVLYTRYRFGWDTMQYGNFMLVYGLSVCFCQLVLVRFFFSTLGESKSLLIFMSIRAVEMAIAPLLSEGWLLYPLGVLSSVGFLAWPTLRSLISRQVGNERQGQAMGAMQCWALLAEMSSELLSSELLGVSIQLERELGYKDGSTPISGFSFWAGCGCVLVAIVYWVRYRVEVDESDQEKASALLLESDCGLVLERKG